MIASLSILFVLTISILSQHIGPSKDAIIIERDATINNNVGNSIENHLNRSKIKEIDN